MHIEINFFLICETFLTNNNADLYKIPGYTMIYKNRTVGTRGGIAIYIKETISFKCRPDIEINIDGEFESIFIETIIKQEKIIIGEIYRVPNTNEQLSLHRFETILERLRNMNINIILGTDQNFDYFKIESQKNTRDLFNHFLSSGIQPTITIPTRVTHATATLIDNIYVKFKQKQDTIKSGTLLYEISDHLPIFMFYSKEIKPKGAPLTFKSRSLNASKMNIIANSLENIDWNNLYEMDVDSAYNHFMQIITNIIDQHAPFRQITINPKYIILTPWMTPALLQSSKTFDKLYRKQLKHPRHHDSHLKYIKYRTLLNKLKRTSKELYYANLFEKYKGDIRKTWKTLNSITGHCNDKSIINSKFHINTKITENTSEIANGFCKYFSEVGETFATKIPKSKHSFNTYLRTERNPKSLFLSPTDPNEINK